MRKTIDIEYLYKRFNGRIGNGYAIQSANTIIKIFLDGVDDPKVLEERIIDSEVKGRFNNPDKCGLVLDKDFIQPKSIFLRLLYLDLVLKSLPETFFDELNLSSGAILQITTSILLYYTGLEVKTIIRKPMSPSQNKYLLRREDYLFGLDELQIVCGGIDAASFKRYVEIFARDVAELNDESTEALYRYGENYFILAKEDFVDYIFLRVERLFYDANDKQAISKYANNKGYGFEDIVYDFLKALKVDSVHGLNYYPSKDKVAELDIVIKDRERLAIIECKSGTINLCGSVSDIDVKNRIKTKVKKAHYSLLAAAVFFEKNDHYELVNKEKTIVMRGERKRLILLNVTMYPIDFISSNLHTLFPEYMEDANNPVITISFEHLFAIILESSRNNRDFLEYFEKRIDYISKYPSMKFENNELDLYYELFCGGKDTMLAELRKQGILDTLSSEARLIGSYHDEYGNESRPAKRMIDDLDECLLHLVIVNGKKAFGVNKRFLKFFEEYITVKNIGRE